MMKTICPKCNASGELECDHCHQYRDCPDCDGEGEIECSIHNWKVPEKHKNRDEVLRLHLDASKCQADYEKLVRLNPRAKHSYDKQLAATLAKIENEINALL